MKRGIFFSIDALIALAIILGIVLLAIPITQNLRTAQNLHYDTLETLSSLQIGEIDNSYVQTLIQNGEIKNLNQSILEQIGEFYVTNITLARELAESVLPQINPRANIGIWYGNTLVVSRNNTPYEDATNIETARQIISGISAGENITGFSSRAQLTNNQLRKYFNFGGYIGDGNISAEINYEGNITSAELELAIDKNFSVYVNSQSVGNYEGSNSDTIPINHEIPITYFQEGENLIELKGDNLRIAGGFLKIEYENATIYEQPNRYRFPGIEGLINLYDSFYIPGNLSSLSISLHMNSSVTNTILTIGNTTIYNGTTLDEETITFSNSELSSLLNYDSLSEETIPLRLGLENVSFIQNITYIADTFSVTDISGSMTSCGEYAQPLVCSYTCLFGGQKSCQVSDPSECTGNVCGGSCFIPFGHSLECEKTALDLAKEANNVFIDAVLNSTGNRVGLVGYATSAPETEAHNLSTSTSSLKDKVDNWIASGETCICCGINKAIQKLDESSTPGRSRSMVVMSDGIANRQCAEQGTGSATQDAIQAACDAYEDYNITVYSIGFGEGADESTLQQIASCGNGAYYFGNADEISQIYEDIAETIIETSFSEQTIETEGNLYTRLYPDSYIEFDYNQTTQPAGLISTVEKTFDNSTTGTFNLPSNSTVVESRIISYSGSKWTQTVNANGQNVYNINDYGEDYLLIGDPYTVNIPSDLIQSQNTITLTTGLSPLNASAGSASNKIIFTTAKNFSAFSAISPTAQGCIWHIQFEDDSEIQATIPSTYTGSENCYYNVTLPQGVTERYNANDAHQVAVFNLLKELDFDDPINYKIDVPFTSQDLQITLNEIQGIPFPWSSEVQIRIWN